MPRKLPRDYPKEYKDYHGKPEQVAARSNRNKAVRSKGREGAGDGKEVDHKDGNPMNNSPKNLRVVSRTTNRKKQ
jgi:hypothetical protein